MGLGCCLDLRIAAYRVIHSRETSLEVPELYKPSHCLRNLIDYYLQGMIILQFSTAAKTAPLIGSRKRASLPDAPMYGRTL